MARVSPDDLAYSVLFLNAVEVAPQRYAARPDPEHPYSVLNARGLVALHAWLHYGVGNGPQERDIVVMPKWWTPEERVRFSCGHKCHAQFTCGQCLRRDCKRITADLATGKEVAA